MMGRKRSIHHDLPPHMTRKGKAYYFVTNDKPRKWLPLGADLPMALKKWAELAGKDAPSEMSLFEYAADKYLKELLPGKAKKTQEEQTRQMAQLVKVFGKVKLDDIKPMHVAKYLAIRKDKDGKPAPVAANREKALLSHVFNCAREWGLTSSPNPCAGISGHAEPGRNVYMTDHEYKRLYEAADDILKDMMDLAYYTGQRPGDVRSMTRADIRDGCIWVMQAKRGARLRVVIEGELEQVLKRIASRPRKIGSVYIIATDRGQKITKNMYDYRMRAALAASGLAGKVQFRDIRAKTGTDLEDLAHAQKLLGHKGRAMTEHYIRQRAGEKVAPLKKKL